jgi:hypothetical protein
MTINYNTLQTPLIKGIKDVIYNKGKIRKKIEIPNHTDVRVGEY